MFGKKLWFEWIEWRRRAESWVADGTSAFPRAEEYLPAHDSQPAEDRQYGESKLQDRKERSNRCARLK